MTFTKTKIKHGKTKTARKAYGGAPIESLMRILETRRPHKSKAESRFIRDFIMSIEGMTRDGFGNCIKRISGPGDNILWSTHVDTVHRRGGKQNLRLHHDMVTLSPNSKSDCLGADDGAGLWLALEMIRAGKPGLYVFHRAEECGGLGSNYTATHTPELFNGIDAAIALDRKGYNDVITHQGSRCASDAFADSLAAGLGPLFRADDTGLFTDTANYVDVVGECSNISVGYFSQHSAKESLDIGFLCDLRERLLALDTSTLVFERKPGDSDWRNDGLGYDFNFAEDSDSETRALRYFDSDDYDSDATAGLAELSAKYPAIAAEIIESFGVSEDEFLQMVYDYTGGESGYDSRIPF